MQGSKYSDELKVKAVAMCAEPKMTPAKVAAKLGIPRTTVYDWYRTEQSNDPDLIAIKRNKLRNLMDKSYSVVGRSLDGLDKQSKHLFAEKKQLDKLLDKLNNSDSIDSDTAGLIADIVTNYTNASMMDCVKIAKEALNIAEKFEGLLNNEKQTNETNVNIYFADDTEG